MQDIKLYTKGVHDACNAINILRKEGYETVHDVSVYINAVGLFAYSSGVILKTDDHNYFVSHPNELYEIVNGRLVATKDYYKQPETPPVAEERPPVGLKPKKLHDQQRLLEIIDAMSSFVSAGKAIPAEWFAEAQFLNGQMEGK